MELSFSTISWEDGRVKILDQTMLPGKLIYRYIKTADEMAEAIQNLRVRGAPLIGAAAAYGVALAAYRSQNREEIEKAIALLKKTRPTAYNLFSGLKLMEKLLQNKHVGQPRESPLQFLEEAHRIRKEDELICEQIGESGKALIPDNACCLTHCNAGALATCGIGTALAPIYLAREKIKRVFVPETRPVLQGARLTAWELSQAGIPVTLICDSARGAVIKEVDLCIVGADRIARNGDTANKIGTYTLAVLAKEHGVPFYVAAPSTTFDPKIESGDEIPIELRKADEITRIDDNEIAPKDIDVFNPAFDVTPHEYITGFITENGIQNRKNGMTFI